MSRYTEKPQDKTVALPNDFERMVPEYHRRTITYGEHVSRYTAALPLVKGKIVLDIACGSGYGTKLLAEAAQKVFGVDVAEDAVKYAETNYSSSRTEYLVGDGVSIPLATASVDVVISFETIEHIPDYKQFLVEVKRVLRPGGVMVLSTPNDLEFAEGNHFHVHEFKLDELVGLTKQYFKHSKTYYQGTWIYAGLLPEQDIKGEWDHNIRTLNTAPIKLDQVLYFFLVCSDDKVADVVPPLGVIAEHWSARDNQEKAVLTDNHISNLQSLIRAAEDEAKRQKADNQAVREELRQITTSRAYKALRVAQRLYHKTKGH
jgi:2-polyprenyl-3-methyl-5-hydroxy-6-metoxy-1,4-benzoquinol methylase